MADTPIPRIPLPFAEEGDKTPINTAQSGPVVNWKYGYTPDYDFSSADPNSQDIQRGEINYLFYIITIILKQYQEQGTPDWYTDISYTTGAICFYNDDVYVSEVDNNLNVPPGTDDTKWISITSAATGPGGATPTTPGTVYVIQQILDHTIGEVVPPTVPTHDAVYNKFLNYYDSTYIDANFAKLDSPAFTGTPTAPTADPSTNTTQIATTAFVAAAIAALVDGAPDVLDTLKEIADALKDNPDIIDTITAQFNNYYTKTEIDSQISDINTEIDTINQEIADINTEFDNYYTKDEIDAKLNNINLVLGKYRIDGYGDNSYIPPNIVGLYQGASPTTDLEASALVGTFEENKLIFLRPGTDGSTAGVYYAYIESDVMLADNHMITTSTAYQPPFLTGTDNVFGLFSSDGQCLFGDIGTTDNTLVTTNHFFVRTYGSLNAANHKGGVIDFDVAIPPGTDHTDSYAFVHNNAAYILFHPNTGNSATFLLYGIDESSIQAGTPHAVLITGWNGGTDGNIILRAMLSSGTSTDNCFIYEPGYNGQTMRTPIACHDPVKTDILNLFIFFATFLATDITDYGFYVNLTLDLNAKTWTIDFPTGYNTVSGGSYTGTNIIGLNGLQPLGLTFYYTGASYVVANDYLFTFGKTSRTSPGNQISILEKPDNIAWNDLFLTPTLATLTNIGRTELSSFGSYFGGSLMGLRCTGGTKWAGSTVVNYGPVNTTNFTNIKFNTNTSTPSYQYQSIYNPTVTIAGYPPTSTVNIAPANTDSLEVIHLDATTNTITGYGGWFPTNQENNSLTFDDDGVGSGVLQLPAANVTPLIATLLPNATVSFYNVLVSQIVGIPSIIFAIGTSAGPTKQLYLAMSEASATISTTVTLTLGNVLIDGSQVWNDTTYVPTTDPTDSYNFANGNFLGCPQLYETDTDLFIGFNTTLYYVIYGNSRNISPLLHYTKSGGVYTYDNYTWICGFPNAAQGSYWVAVPGQKFGACLLLPEQSDANTKFTFQPVIETAADFTTLKSTLDGQVTYDHNIPFDTSTAIVISSQEVPTGFIVYFGPATATLNGMYYNLEATNIDLITVDNSPANKTFYIYLGLVNGNATYIISGTPSSEIDYIQIGTCTTDAEHVSAINVNNAFKIDGYYIETTSHGQSIVAATGDYNSPGDLSGWNITTMMASPMAAPLASTKLNSIYGIKDGVFYNKNNKLALRMNRATPPDGYTVIKPTYFYDKWDEGKWVLDKEKATSDYILQLNTVKNNLLSLAELVYNRTQMLIVNNIDVANIEISNTWKQFHLDVYNVVINESNLNITWPKMPAIPYNISFYTSDLEPFDEFLNKKYISNI